MNYLQPLDQPLQRVALVLFSRSVDVKKSKQDGICYTDDYCHDEYYVCSMQIPYHAVVSFVEDIWERVHHKSRNQQKDVMTYLPFHQIWMPLGTYKSDMPN